MNNQDYSATIIVDQPPSTAFTAIINFRGWWSEDIEGKTDQEGEEFFYHYKDVHLCKLKLIEKIPATKLVYQVLENQFSFIEDKSEWKDTQLIFDLIPEGEKTKIIFTHKGLVPQYECYKVCREAWTNYITNSLFKYITTGKGEPNPKEGEGFNAQITEKWKINVNENKDFRLRFMVDSSPKEVYDAILNVRGWWSGLFGEEIIGESHRVNDEFTFTAGGGVHYSKQKLIELVPENKVTWLVTDSNLSFLKQPDEWINTKISFEISQLEGKTQVIFTHQGLVPDIECYDSCSTAWSQYLHQFLQPLKNKFKNKQAIN